MEDNSNRDSEKEELEREARFLRRLGIAGIVTGGLMCVPAVVLRNRGYDMQTLDTVYEAFAGVSMMSAIVPFCFGLLNFMEGNVEYIHRKRK